MQAANPLPKIRSAEWLPTYRADGHRNDGWWIARGRWRCEVCPLDEPHAEWRWYVEPNPLERFSVRRLKQGSAVSLSAAKQAAMWSAWFEDLVFDAATADWPIQR